MSTERHFPLSEDRIFATERQRAMGSLAEVVQATRPAIEFPLEDFPQLSEDEKSDC